MPQTARGGRKTSTRKASGTRTRSRTGASKVRSRSTGSAKKSAKKTAGKKTASAKRGATARRSATRSRPAAASAKPRARVTAAAVATSASVAARTNGSRSDKDRVRAALMARRAETLALLERSSEFGKQRLREDAEDLVDQATDSQARDVVYALSSAEGDMIKLIDGALERLEQGDYGTCVSCGEPIQRRRLEAVPWATLCVACQELQEQGVLQAD